MTAASAQDIVEWLHKILREHGQSTDERGASHVVLPTSMAERERWMPLVETAFRAAGGEVVDATSCGERAECGDIESSAPGLLEHVRALLNGYNLLDPTSGLDLVVTDGWASVVGSGPIDSVNAAQRAVREVATAMCDLRLRSNDLAGVVYAEDSLDGDAIGLVLSSLMKLVAHLRPHAETTFCVIAGDSTLHVQIHCTGDPSLRFRIGDERLQVRRPYGQSIRTVRELGSFDAAAAPLVVLFLGAGASASAGLPMGDSLRDRALERLTGKVVGASNFAQVAGGWFKELAAAGKLQHHERDAGLDEFVRTLTLERVLEYEQGAEGTANCTTIRRFAAQHGDLVRELEARRAVGGLADHPIVRLCARRRRLVLVTVNFDQFIEARAAGDVQPYYSAEQLQKFPEDLEKYRTHGGPIPLLKLHGDIGAPETLVATIGEATAGLSGPRQQAIEALVKTVESQDNKPWWYVGYSMRDRDLENIWKGAAFSQFNEHWVSPFLDSNVDAFIASCRVYHWNAQIFSRDWNGPERLVSLTADDFFAELADVADAEW